MTTLSLQGMGVRNVMTMLKEEKWVTLAIAYAIISYIYFSYRRRPKLPPGPKPWPVIGNLNLMGSLPHQSIDALSKRYGPIMTVHLGSARCVIASSTEMAEVFLKNQDTNFAGRPKLAAGKYTTYNYENITWCQYNDNWRLARKLCMTELFSARRLDELLYIRVQEIHRMISSIHHESLQGKVVNVREETSTASNNIISRMVFGKRYLDEDAGHVIRPREFKDMIEELFILNGVFNLGDFIPSLSFFDLQGYVKRMKIVAKKFNVFLDEVIEEHLQRMKGVEGYEAKDLVDVLLQLSADPEINLSRTRVKAYTQDIIAGGTESSATLMEWGLSELLKKPEVMRKAWEELDEVIGQERWVEEKDIANLPYIDGIVKETMRLHPVAPMLVPRMAIEDCKIQGYDIPKGTRIMVNVWTIARDGSIWESPLEFKPERFIGKNIDVKGRDYELLPFGSGRRMCPGYSLGHKVVNVGLANLIHGFIWSLPEGHMAGDLDMMETFGLSTPRAEPLVALAHPRLSPKLYNQLP